VLEVVTVADEYRNCRVPAGRRFDIPIQVSRGKMLDYGQEISSRDG